MNTTAPHRRFPGHLAIGFVITAFTIPAVALADSALLATPRIAPGNHQPDLMVGKSLRGRLLGNNVYLSQPSPRQTLVRSAAATVTSLFKVQNDTPASVAPTFSVFSVRSKTTSPRTGVTYLDGKRRNVTAQLARGRYLLNIAASADRLIYQKITAPPATSAGGSFGLKAEHRGTRRADSANVSLLEP